MFLLDECILGRLHDDLVAVGAQLADLLLFHCVVALLQESSAFSIVDFQDLGWLVI